MRHVFDLTHFSPTGRTQTASFFSLIGPAIRIARAVETGSMPDDADLHALGIKRTAFEYILAAQSGLPDSE